MSIQRSRALWAYLVVLALATVASAAWWVYPRLAPVSYDDTDELAQWAQLEPHLGSTAQRWRVPGYARDRFGPGWETKGACSTREAVLQAAADIETPSQCTISNTQILDRFTGKTVMIGSSTAHVDIDHIFPLSAAWDLGAHAWDEATRRKFANDPLNLVATSSAINRDKSDSLPANWLPPHRPAQCWYARRLALVAIHYELALPVVDLAAMRKVCTIIIQPENLLPTG